MKGGRRKAPPWSREEINILRNFYPREGIDCADRLPDRSWQAIHQKAHKLGLKCERLVDAPAAKLQGELLEEAIRLREQDRWSFARIGAKIGFCEATVCNAVLIALCPRKGYTPAQRDEHGCLTDEGIGRLRYALKKGLKGVDIQLRLGLSAGRVAEERRRYNRELKEAGKAPLPPPGGGEAYSGLKLTAAKKREVEDLFLQGLGTLKVSERTGASTTSCTRIRNRLVKRLKRKGETLPGCDEDGARRVQAESSRFIPEECKASLRAMILDRVPVARAARLLSIGSCSAYRIRDELAADLAARGEKLPRPDRALWGRGSAGASPFWPPRGAKQIYAFRELMREMAFDEAKAEFCRQRREEREAERRRPKSFEEQLRLVASGRVGLTTNFARRHLEPALTAEKSYA